MLLFALNVLDWGYFAHISLAVYADMKLRIIFGLAAVTLLVTNFLFAQAISDRKLREKTIAFDNPSGRVTVSLMALEDLVRKVVLSSSSDVKEIKVNIIVSRKGRLDVFAKLTLQADVNIPEMTSVLQESIKRKIQDTVGLEEPVIVRIHVAKIAPTDVKAKSIERPQYERSIPFQGYRA